MVIENVFVQVSILVIVAFLISSLSKLFKQPIIIGYIIAGVLVGPAFLNVIQETDTLSSFAKIGVAMLLFMVGLNLHPKVIKEVGKVAFFAGIGQIIFTFILTYFIALLLNFSTTSAIYIALALSFSSTIIIMKLLSDKGEVQTLHGRIIIGSLIIQDLIIIFSLMIISSISGSSNIGYLAINSILKGGIAIIALSAIGYFVLPKATEIIAKSQELLLLFSISWALALASLFAYLGFSIEIGALIAGITLALSPYRYEISSRIKPLRDFFVLIFFIVLGSQMTFTNISSNIIPILLFSVIIILFKPLINIILISRMNYTKRTGFLTGISSAQISEFSFILLALGVSLNHISSEIISIVTISGLTAIVFNTYFVFHSNSIYSKISSFLSIFEKKGRKKDYGKYHQDEDFNIILFGYNRIGYDLLETFKKIKEKFLVVDYNPETISSLAKKGIDSRYGDAGDYELLSDLNLKSPRMIISTIPDLDTNILLIEEIRKSNKDAIIIVIAHQIDDALKLYSEGASYVIMPHFLGGTHTADLIEKYKLNPSKFEKEKENQIRELKSKKLRGHEHPLHERD